MTDTQRAPRQAGTPAPAPPHPPQRVAAAGTSQLPRSDDADGLSRLLRRAVDERSGGRVVQRMMVPSEFTELGGAPSRKRGSGYSKIVAALGVVDDLELWRAQYLSRPKRRAARNLYSALTGFHPASSSGDVPVLSATKTKQIQAARRLQKEMEDEHLLDEARVSELLDGMAGSSMPLIRNTGTGLRELFEQRKLAMRFAKSSTTNAQWEGNSFTFFSPSFWKSDKLAKAVLVHEYHHYLTERAPKLYTDEFVAHWKQYQAMGARKTAAYLNDWLLDRAGGYQMRNDAAQFDGREFAGPEDAGEVWTDYRHNKRAG